MRDLYKVIITFFVLTSFLSCGDSNKSSKHLVDDFVAINTDNSVNVVVEISAGDVEKWEVNKETGLLEHDTENGKKRIINYLGYPANYGFIPQTFLSPENGGDGDPLDVIILGERIEKSSVVKCRLIGVMLLEDRGETDDKLIAITFDSKFANISTIEELNSEYLGITDILKTWFTNYKGPNKMEFKGYANYVKAQKVLQIAIQDYRENK